MGIKIAIRDDSKVKIETKYQFAIIIKNWIRTIREIIDVSSKTYMECKQICKVIGWDIYIYISFSGVISHLYQKICETQYQTKGGIFMYKYDKNYRGWPVNIDMFN